MKTKNYLFASFFILSLISCSSDSPSDYSLSADGAGASDYKGSSSSSSSGSGNGEDNQYGLITAGEWNDLDNWDFWKDLLNENDYSDKPGYWNIYTNNRLSFIINNGTTPIINAKLELHKNGNTIWETKTDNFGKAEMWISLFEKDSLISINDFLLFINGNQIDQELKLFKQGINEIQVNNSQNNQNSIELCFIVDATGSMGDELEFLKDDLEDVIERVRIDNLTVKVSTSTVFYRDEGDEYVVKLSDFSTNFKTTLEFIKKQKAGGGGDFPEAVHTALSTAINNLQWSENAKSRIAFLLLDAPPHYKSEIVKDLHKSIKEASKKGIKIIPITASGIDKETEFLMRFMSISTNGTYVFITNDSGIGNDHLTATVGEYEVEFLNDLMVRLIQKYID